MLVALLLPACSNAREHDCKQVRSVVALEANAMPRRYYDYSPRHELAPVDTLRTMTWRDPDVRAAVKAYLTVDTGWTVYTPYSAATSDTYRAAPSALDSLRSLCAD